MAATKKIMMATPIHGQYFGRFVCTPVVPFGPRGAEKYFFCVKMNDLPKN
jgi:hypothetical protein